MRQITCPHPKFNTRDPTLALGALKTAGILVTLGRDLGSCLVLERRQDLRPKPGLKLRIRPNGDYMNYNESTDSSELIKFLMQYDDDEFITQSYKFVLHRKVDIGGLLNYRKALYKSGSKAKVLLDILSSKEGRSKNDWAEMVAAVRQVRRREWLRKIGFTGVWTAICRGPTVGHEAGSTQTYKSSYEVSSVPEISGPTYSPETTFNDRKYLCEFERLYSPRAVRIANILASTERR
jgi:hypothetical protein